jgi:hypothetical protein
VGSIQGKRNRHGKRARINKRLAEDKSPAHCGARSLYGSGTHVAVIEPTYEIQE